MGKYTPEKIGKLIVFYIIFYTILSLFWGAMFYAFYKTLDTKQPKFKLKDSLIGTSPAMGFRPMPDPDTGSALIRYNTSNSTNTEYWTEQLNTLLGPYEKTRDIEGPYVICEDGTPPTNETEICEVPVNNWYPCVSSNKYNYNSKTGGPCIFLKLNKIFDWKPEFYNMSNVAKNMPETIKYRIGKLQYHLGSNSTKLKVVWVSCDGEKAVDIENIGPITYFPNIGFDGQYFPYRNIEGYLSPLVAVYFENPARGVIINVECRVWATNIKYNRSQRQGSVHFEILIES